MKKIGKIGSFDEKTGAGVILLTDTKKSIEFDIKKWLDYSTFPSFGMTVEVLENGIKPYDEKLIVKNKISFVGLRNKIYNNIKDNKDYIIKSDKGDSFYLSNKQTNGYIHLTKDDEENFKLEITDCKFENSFLEELKNYLVDIQLTLNGEKKYLRLINQ